MKRRRLLWVWQRMCQCGLTVDKALLHVEVILSSHYNFVGDIELLVDMLCSGLFSTTSMEVRGHESYGLCLWCIVLDTFWI
jgi:hypothetical protein